MDRREVGERGRSRSSSARQDVEKHLAFIDRRRRSFFRKIEMRIVGKIDAKASSFAELLRGMEGSPCREVLAGTIVNAGLATDRWGRFLCRAMPDEVKEVRKTGWEAEDVDVALAKPAGVGGVVATARESAKGLLVLLEGKSGERAFVEAGPFLTLVKRFPNAEWRFAGRSIIAVQRDGFSEGELLAILAALDLGSSEPSSVASGKSKKKAKR